MNPFQRAYDIIRSWKTPSWLRELLVSLQDILTDVVRIVGQDALSYLEQSIISQSRLDNTNREKMDNVIQGFRNRFDMKNVSDSMLNTSIELLLQKLKKEEWI